MAEAILSCVLQKIADSTLRKTLELYHVSDQIEPMQRELRMIQALMKDADSKRKSNSVKQWLYEVRNVAFRIEDAIDTFLVEIEDNNLKGSGFFSKLKRIRKGHPLKLNELAGTLKGIVQTLETLYKRRTDLGIEVLSAGNEEKSFVPFRPSKLAEIIDDSEIVGFESDKQHIVNHLLDNSISRRTVYSIIGIGGLGKTTLAKKVYKSAELNEKFECRAWLSISQQFNLTTLLREILYSIEPHMKNRDPPVKDEYLVEQIQISLDNKKYLIVLDDVWTEDLWERLKVVLPDKENGSRVLFTSRFLDIATAADCNTKPYKLRYLEEDESLALLFRKSFQKHIHPEDCPPLLEVAKKLTKKCGGLPLALVALGGILTKREPTFAAWQRIEQTMDWHTDKSDNCMNILAMSYDDLPFQLKPCFLYFCSFPEDYEISAKHITRMWIAEGFIPNDGEGTLENRAEDFLEELIKRCLVQVVEKSWNGYCKRCRMHDLLRDLAIYESKENNLLTVFSKEEHDSQLADRETRRAALQSHTPTWYGTHSTNIRSLLCFGKYGLNYLKFRLLRVLVIQDIKFMSDQTKVDKNLLKGLVHLRYLGFRNCNNLPIGFGNISFSTLKNLETFDCKNTDVDCINDSLWEVPTLRHVIMGKESNTHCPLKWDGLKNLQTLKWVKLVDIIPQLECNVKLLTLIIENNECGSVEERWNGLNALLLRTDRLVSLRIGTGTGAYQLPFLTVGTRDLPCHENIQVLRLIGEWARGLCVPSVGMFPTNLTKLVLSDSFIVQDLMPILERLQCLKVLELWMNSYLGEKMICSTGGFPSLQKLILQGLPSLSEWVINEGAMPILNQLTISCCGMLRTLPDLQHVCSLQELILICPSFELYTRLQLEDLHKIEFIPKISIEISDAYNDEDHDDYGEDNDDYGEDNDDDGDQDNNHDEDNDE